MNYRQSDHDQATTSYELAEMVYRKGHGPLQDRQMPGRTYRWMTASEVLERRQWEQDEDVTTAQIKAEASRARAELKWGRYEIGWHENNSWAEIGEYTAEPVVYVDEVRAREQFGPLH